MKSDVFQTSPEEGNIGHISQTLNQEGDTGQGATSKESMGSTVSAFV